MTVVSLPDLITASPIASRAISLWATAWATITLLRIVFQALMEGRPSQVRSTSSFPLVLHDPRRIHNIQERFLLRYRPRYRPLAASAIFAFLPYRRVLWRSDAESLRSLVLGRALPLSLRTVQDVINLSCRHPHHASSLSVASESARCSSCGNCGNIPCRASSRVRPCKTFDCLASSSSRKSSRDRFSRLFLLFERRAVLQRSSNLKGVFCGRPPPRLDDGHCLLCHC